MNNIKFTVFDLGNKLLSVTLMGFTTEDFTTLRMSYAFVESSETLKGFNKCFIILFTFLPALLNGFLYSK